MNDDQIDPNVALRAMVQIRGLTEGGNKSPLLRFRGRLLAIIPRAHVGFNNKAETWVDMKFDQAIIVETRPGETYPFETAEVSIRLSTQKNSGWGYFSASLVNKIPEDKEIWDCIGTTMEMVCTEHLYGYSRDQTIPDPSDPTKTIPQPMIGDVWNVVSLQGSVAAQESNAGSSAALSSALRILDGKSAADFNSEVWKDAEAKADPNLSSMLLASTFIPSMIEAKRVTVDEQGIHHLVSQESPVG